MLAEGAGTLRQRLGEPAAYAAELLAATGVTGATAPPTRPDRLAALRERAEPILRRADLRVGPMLGYPKATDFLVLLRPAWWVLRGYLFAMVVAHLLDNGSEPIGLLPRIGGSEVIALLLLGAGIVASIWLGRRGTPTKPWPRYVLRSGTAVLIILAWAGFAGADSDARHSPFVDSGYQGGDTSPQVRDIFVYDSEGRLVEGAHLYDQDGTPVLLGETWCSDPQSGDSWQSRSRGYPHCPQLNPFRSPGASPSGPAPSGSAPSGPAPSGPAPSVLGSVAPSPQPAPPQSATPR